MNFQFANDQVEITAPMYLQEILDQNSVTESVPTPASNNLFTLDDESPLLDQAGKEHFHTVTAQLLYLSKRVRPDIQLAVSFLTTRVQNPTNQDLNKLHRVLKYLKGTQHLALTLRASDHFRFSICIDASYATHTDLKSHIGSVV